jgi:hypothetical protein
MLLWNFHSIMIRARLWWWWPLSPRLQRLALRLHGGETLLWLA